MVIEFGLVKKIYAHSMVKELKGAGSHVATWKIVNALPHNICRVTAQKNGIKKLLSSLSRPELELTLKNIRGY